MKLQLTEKQKTEYATENKLTYLTPKQETQLEDDGYNTLVSEWDYAEALWTKVNKDYKLDTFLKKGERQAVREILVIWGWGCDMHDVEKDWLLQFVKEDGTFDEAEYYKSKYEWAEYDIDDCIARGNLNLAELIPQLLENKTINLFNCYIKKNVSVLNDCKLAIAKDTEILEIVKTLAEMDEIDVCDEICNKDWQDTKHFLEALEDDKIAEYVMGRLDCWLDDRNDNEEYENNIIYSMHELIEIAEKLGEPDLVERLADLQERYAPEMA